MFCEGFVGFSGVQNGYSAYSGECSDPLPGPFLGFGTILRGF